MYRIQKKLPAVKFLYKKAEEWIGQGSEDEETVAAEAADFGSSDYQSALSGFLKKASDPVKQRGAQLIIFYHPTMTPDGDGNLENSTDRDALAMFRTLCEKNGIVFVDMAEDFERLYKEEHRMAYGFINTSVGKGHLNRYGHRAVAERLAEVIGSIEQE